jgi:hypothetical protein
LENENNALLMNWFPEFIPRHIRVIVSALPGVTADALSQRHYKVFEVPELDESYRQKLVNDYLAIFGKKLNPKQAKRIAQTGNFGNPLLLTSFLEELRIFGSFEKLDSFINSFLELPDNESYFEQILIRIENDFTFSTNAGAGKIFSLIWRSRKGLSEREIIEIAAIRPLDWSQLSLASGFHLINKGGYINFAHDFFRKAVERRYLTGEDLKNSAAAELIEYFESDRLDIRSMQELPYLYSAIQDWDSLTAYLTDPDVFLKLFESDEVEFKRLCIPIRENPDFSKSFNKRWKKSKHCRNVYFGSGIKTANILNELGFYSEALSILSGLYRKFDKLDIVNKDILLFKLGSISRNIGQYKVAIKYLNQCYEIRVKEYGKNSLPAAEIYTMLGYAYDWQGNYILAEDTFKKSA